MRWLLAAALLAWAVLPAQAQTVGPAPIVCNASYEVSQGAVALTRIVPGVATKQTVLCGWAVNTGAAAGTAQLESGTGTNCGTGNAPVTPAISLGANGSYVDHTAWASLSLSRSTDLCLVTTGTGPTQVTVYYGQY